MFAKENCIFLGTITRTHGIHGQLVLASELPLSKADIEEPILVDIDGGLVPFYLNNSGFRARDHQSYLICFDHTNNREQAEKYVNSATYLLTPPFVEADNLPKQEPALLKNYTIHNERNEYLGKVDEVLDFSGNILLRTFINEKEVLLPFTEAHIINWDSSKRSIQLQIPDGLLEL